MFNIEQPGTPDPAILVNTMAKTPLQAACKTVLDDFHTHPQLARVVSEVVRELENATTQAMIEVCHNHLG